MKGEMEVEVLKDTTDSDALATARKRAKRIFKTAAEQELYCENPNATALSDRAAYSTDPDYLGGD